MVDAKKETPFDSPARSVFSIDCRSDGEWAEGEWVDLPIGFRVLIAPRGTQESQRVGSRLLRKFGKGRLRDFEDLTPVQASEYTARVLAEANWKAFEAPGEPRDEMRVADRRVKDTIADRFWLLQNVPAILSQVSRAVDDVTRRFESDAEDAGKNL